MRIDLNSLSVTKTDDPVIYIVSGRATDDDNSITNDQKTWYSFDVRWNVNRPVKKFIDVVAAAIEPKKPSVVEGTIISELAAGNGEIVDMTAEDPE